MATVPITVTSSKRARLSSATLPNLAMRNRTVIGTHRIHLIVRIKVFTKIAIMWAFKVSNKITVTF